MLAVSTTEEFSDWFRSLEDCDAEAVATGISLIESLGPERSPPNSTDLVLWYQASSGPLQRFNAESLAIAQRTRRFVDHLSSVNAQQRVAELSSEGAARFRAGMSLVLAHARRWRRGHGLHDEDEVLELRAAYRSVLEVLAIREPPEEMPTDTLREMAFTQGSPGLRVLYGVDAKRQRALLILGREHWDGGEGVSGVEV